MREVAQQLCFGDQQLEHDAVVELAEIAKLVTELEPEILPEVKADLLAGVRNPNRGRRGMSPQQVLRCLILQVMRGLTFRSLAFQLHDSQSAQVFCGFNWTDTPPVASTLHDNISKITPETLRAINEAIVQKARSERIDYGRKVAIDCTVVESKIPYPADSGLLWDCVRVLYRLGKRYAEAYEMTLTNKTLAAKKTAQRIFWTRTKKKRRPLYDKLLRVTRAMLLEIDTLVDDIDEVRADTRPEAHDEELRLEVEHYIATTQRVISQTERRWAGETVPADQKLVSIFEQHADIICKDYRTTYFGHKISVTTGHSDLVLDYMVHKGNRNDAEMAEELLERQIELYDRPPRQVAMDGAFCSRKNLKVFKGRGVKDVAFSRRRGIPIDEMAASKRIYRRLKKFRCSIERVISFVKRRCGLRECTWSGMQGFKRYVGASIVTANLLTFVRKRIAKRDTS